MVFIMRLEKNKRLKLKARKNLISRNIHFPRSSLYNGIGVSFFGGMSRKCAFIHIQEIQENNIIKRLDKVLKAC